jgi:hypothetical protein
MMKNRDTMKRRKWEKEHALKESIDVSAKQNETSPSRKRGRNEGRKWGETNGKRFIS